MMSHNEQLKLQSYLDGELSAAESAEVELRLAKDSDGRLLLEELRRTNAALVNHEAEIKLPESREFFWSKIEREIQRQDSVPVSAPKLSWYAWVQKHVLPLTGVAAACCILGIMEFHSGKTPISYGELNLASDQMGAYTFRDQQEQMTMVWLYDRKADDSQFTDSASVASLKR